MKTDLIYGVEDRPPFKEALFAALQHLLAIFVAIITPPLIIASALKLDVEKTGFLVSMSLFASGVSTFVQCRRFGPVGKSVEAVERDFGAVRAGRANASVLNRIQVDYYGTPTPIQQIAAVASPDPRTLLITPWDASALKGIEKAIQESDLGINPQNDGKSIRLAFPQLTEERRKELVKQIRKYNEGGKVAIRNIRRDAMESFKKKEKASEITEDDLKQAEKDLQKLTDDSSKKIDELLARKEKELREI